MMRQQKMHSHEEVVWLDVSVDEVLGVDVLDPGDELVGQEQDSLETEPSERNTNPIEPFVKVVTGFHRRQNR